eukprot:gb/GECG01015710.1/.p1 GENE.gb/GECG01015710.1/~~gb/GECG01015710.1/.p1  ORF type:complete len:306 (+),score=38.70 gb/GECG01015710.1/:1-918(+)
MDDGELSDSGSYGNARRGRVYARRRGRGGTASSASGQGRRRSSTNPVHIDVDLASDSDSDSDRTASQSAARARKTRTQQKKKKKASGAGTSSDSATKKRRKKTASEPKAEQRLKRYRPKQSVATTMRIKRALGQRMFLLDEKMLHSTEDGHPYGHFVVLGSRGNAYDVTIDRLVSCQCPDFLKGNLCKHVIFVLVRVLGRAQNDPLVWQQALLTSELQDIFDGAEEAGRRRDVLANDAARRAYKLATSGETAEGRGLLGDITFVYQGSIHACYVCIRYVQLLGDLLKRPVIARFAMKINRLPMSA